MVLTRFKGAIFGSKSLIQELKRLTGPFLRKSDYKEIFSRIHGSNETLQTLTKQSCQLEPSRQRRSQWRLIQVVRKVSQSIFNALQRSLTCQCPHSHDLSLELRLRELVVLDSERDEDVAKSLDFHVALGSIASPIHPGSHRVKDPGCQKWKHIKVQIIQDDSTPPSITPLSTPLSTPPMCTPPGVLRKDAHSRKIKKSVLFYGVFSWVGTKESSLLTTTISPSPTIQITPAANSTNHCHEKQKELLSDLCSAIHMSESSPLLNCCGYVADTLWDHETKFGIYPTTYPAFPASVQCTALRTALVGEQPNLPPFEFAQRLEISLALVISALQLYQTSWVTDIIIIDDIMFFHEAQNNIYRPFIVKSLQKPDRKPSSQCLARVNTVLLSLGVLLINLALHNTQSTLEMIRSTDINSVLSIYEHASNLICRLPVYGSNNYTAAAKWCLDNVIGQLDSFGHDSFCQDFYSNVVVPLNEDAKVLLST
ncbi:hypothetical protein LCI18_002962 [Fusarium solani-melongenae]|uniref:Uncharacterized protein n=1 Tax=Fusarium solani subsp. cucurbitae TaxID=2747967 RepID=A0ACD3YSR5_FUSSC|nr:hypothetical protein LCI18_002962 [Fusarium solani-melongenae]